jgi:hypothetical protein
MIEFDDPKDLPLAQVDSEIISTSNDYVVAGWDVDKVAILQSPRVQTQFIRRHVAIETGVPNEWNWRDYPRIDGLKRDLTPNSKIAQRHLIRVMHGN